MTDKRSGNVRRNKDGSWDVERRENGRFADGDTHRYPTKHEAEVAKQRWEQSGI